MVEHWWLLVMFEPVKFCCLCYFEILGRKVKNHFQYFVLIVWSLEYNNCNATTNDFKPKKTYWWMFRISMVRNRMVLQKLWHLLHNLKPSKNCLARSIQILQVFFLQDLWNLALNLANLAIKMKSFFARCENLARTLQDNFLARFWSNLARKQVDILISKNQALQIYLKHCVYKQHNLNYHG